MKKTSVLKTGILISAIFFLAVGALCSEREVPQFIKLNIESTSPLVKDQPVKFRFDYKVNPQFVYLAGDEGDVTMTLTPLRDEKEVLAKYEWPVKYDKDYSNTLEFDLVIPDNNVFVLNYYITCGKVIQDGSYFLNSIGKNIEITDALIDPPMPRDHYPSEISLIQLDQLTADQKKKVFKFAVDLSDPTIRESVESIIGPVSDENVMDQKRSSYLIETTLDKAIKIGKLGTEIDFVNRPKWRFDIQKQEYDLIEDTSTSIE